MHPGEEGPSPQHWSFHGSNEDLMLGAPEFGKGGRGPVESIFPEGTIKTSEEGPDFQRMRVCKFFL
jgi:hypothetical protein